MVLAVSAVEEAAAVVPALEKVWDDSALLEDSCTATL